MWCCVVECSSSPRFDSLILRMKAPRSCETLDTTLPVAYHGRFEFSTTPLWRHHICLSVVEWAETHTYFEMLCVSSRWGGRRHILEHPMPDNEWATQPWVLRPCVYCSWQSVNRRSVVRYLQGHHQLLTTNSVQQSHSWEANSFSTSQEIPRILWNPKFHYQV
jgi:hypothetical protein